MNCAGRLSETVGRHTRQRSMRWTFTRPGIVNIGKPEGFVRRQVRGWADRWQRSKTGELPEMDEVIEWLEQRIAARDHASDATIVHNDFKLDNLMLDAADPSRVIAVLDWEMTTVGDPLIDLGLVLTYWTMGERGGDPASSLRAVTNGPGWMTREEIIQRYEAKTGRDFARLCFTKRSHASKLPS